MTAEDFCEEVGKLGEYYREFQSLNDQRYNLQKEIIEEVLDLLNTACEDDLVKALKLYNITPLIQSLESLNTRFSNFFNPNHPHQQNQRSNLFRDIVNYLNNLYHILKYLNVDIYSKKIPAYTKKLKQLEKIKSEYEETLETLQEAKKEFEDKLKEIEDVLPHIESIEEIYEEIDDLNEKKDNFLENLNLINEIKDKITNLKHRIEEEKEELIKTKTEIDNIKNDLEIVLNEKSEEFLKLKEKYENSLSEKSEELNDLINKAKETLEWTEASALKTAYEQRSEELEKEAEKRYKHFLLASALAVVLALFVIFGGEWLFKENGFLFNIARITIILPAFLVVYGLWRSWHQTKLLADEYNNKKIMAENLMIGANTLKERLEVDEEETKETFLYPTINILLEDPIEKIYNLSNKENESYISRLFPSKSKKEKEED